MRGAQENKCALNGASCQQAGLRRAILQMS